jgi:hypothetical protein
LITVGACIDITVQQFIVSIFNIIILLLFILIKVDYNVPGYREENQNIRNNGVDSSIDMTLQLRNIRPLFCVLQLLLMGNNISACVLPIKSCTFQDHNPDMT